MDVKYNLKTRDLMLTENLILQSLSLSSKIRVQS